MFDQDSGSIWIHELFLVDFKVELVKTYHADNQSLCHSVYKLLIILKVVLEGCHRYFFGVKVMLNL